MGPPATSPFVPGKKIRMLNRKKKIALQIQFKCWISKVKFKTCPEFLQKKYTTVDLKQLQKLQSWENRPRRRTQHPRPAGRQHRRQAGRQVQGGRHSIPVELEEKMGDKLRDKAADSKADTPVHTKQTY